MSDLIIMNKMAQENKDISCSTTLVEAKTVKKGGHVTIGVDHQSIVNLALPNNKYAAILYVVNMDEFKEIKKSEAQND